MKSLFSILILVISLSSISAQGIVFFEGDLAAAKEKAAKEDKLIFIDAYTTWCGPCKWMANTTFKDKEVGEMYNSKFIPFKLDMEKGEGIDFAKEYKVNGFPTLLFLDSEGTLMHKFMGAVEADKFLVVGATALDPNLRIGSLDIRYKSGERGDEFIQKYLAAASDALLETDEVRDWYFYGKTDEELMKAVNVNLITDLYNDPNHKEFLFLMKNQKACQEYSELSLTKYFNFVFTRDLSKAHRISDKAYDEAVSNMIKTGYENADELVAKMEISNLQRAEVPDWALITDSINNYFDKYGVEDWGMRNELAWEYYSNDDIQDEKLLKSALKWVKESVEIKEQYMNMDTYAALLYKLKMKKKGIKIATKAIELARKSGDGAEETVELLEKINKL